MILTEEQTMLQDAARRFVTEKVRPYSADWEKRGEIPRDIIDELGALGFLSMTIPEQFGGTDLDFVSYALSLIEIASGDGALSTLISVHNSPSASTIVKAGNSEQQEKFLPRMASGEWIGAFGLTEPQAGSDASNLKTRAVKNGSSYIINGSKQFITSGRIGSLMIVFAVTDPAAGSRGISAFIVPTDTPGYQVTRIEEKLGQNASDTCLINFEDMEIAEENRIGEEGEGYKLALANLETGRIGIAAQCVGMAQHALDYAVDYAKEREAFKQPIYDFQAVQFRLSDMATKLEASRQLTLHAASMKDAGQACLKEACMAKLFASEIAEEVCSASIQTLGGYGYLKDFPVEKTYRDVRVCQIYEGTSDIQKLIIGRNL
ncbi:MAG: acyl-CoA dehydrogenase family protein [Pseudomonadota bacterium]